MLFMDAAIVLGALFGPMAYYAVLWVVHERLERALTARAATLQDHPDIEQLDTHLDMWYG